MSLAQVQQRLEVSRPLTGTEKQDIYDAANRSVNPKLYAKLGLRKHAIAIRPAGGEWNNEDPIIIRARIAHDEGRGVMVSETVGGWCVLYLVPHLWRVKRRPYFSRKLEE